MSLFLLIVKIYFFMKRIFLLYIFYLKKCENVLFNNLVPSFFKSVINNFIYVYLRLYCLLLIIHIYKYINFTVQCIVGFNT